MGQLECHSGRQGIHGVLETGFATVNPFQTPPAHVPFVKAKIQESLEMPTNMCVHVYVYCMCCTLHQDLQVQYR